MRQARLRIGTVVFLLMIGFSSPARSDVVTDWNEKLVEVLLIEKSNPLFQSRNAAIVHVAIFEAANSVDRRFVPYAKSLDIPEGTLAEVAAASAAHRALVTLYPRQASSLDKALEQALQLLPDVQGKRTGVTLGQQAADAILRLRASDGSDATKSLAPANEPGVWVPGQGVPPLGVHWPDVTPWALKSGSQFRPAPPPGLTSEEFRRDYLEALELGGKSSTRRTQEQTQIARFWIPPGVPMWSPVARQLARARGLPLVDNARAFALLSIAAADAILACWDAKYAHRNHRPVAAIRNGGIPGNLPVDSNWEPAVETPPFPAYVSGHACFGGAAYTVLEAIFGTRMASSITIKSPSTPGYERRYSTLEEILSEASDARIWGGIHWRVDQTEGEKLGRSVARYVLANTLRSRP